MSTIIRASKQNRQSQAVAFNFDDMAVEADKYLAKIRTDAAKLVVKAQAEADAVRRRAESEGQQAGMQAVENMVRQKLATVIPALKKAAQDIQDARHAWLAQWESGAVHLAAEIAKRVIRRQLSAQPEITLELVRESLELAAGSSELRILLNPADVQSLGKQVQFLIDELSPHMKADVKADPDITSGGCRVETRFGAIDQQFESQLLRIEEELKQ